MGPPIPIGSLPRQPQWQWQIQQLQERVAPSLVTAKLYRHGHRHCQWQCQCQVV